MGKERYRVEPYSWENLVALFLAGAHEGQQQSIEGKAQIRYLDQYCRAAGVSTLLLEAPYIDRHYSEDFSGYYVKCHHEYPKFCSRLHFFRQPITSPDLENYFEDQASAFDFSSKGYHGFVVIKPLPQTIIGRTCLKPLVATNEDPMIGPMFLTENGYKPNLFGSVVEIEALPFQEQDHEVGACATSAMWTALHGTAHVFETPILSPLQITKRAFSRHPMPGVSLPSDGLEMNQLAEVFRDVGLEADQISAKEIYMLQAVASAYLRAKIPVILSINFHLDPKVDPLLHGITVTGIGKMDGPIRPLEGGFRLRASRINTLYTHDDGVGPYCELKLDPKKNQVTTGWIDHNGKPEKARPEILLVPVYHKLRVRFQPILWALTYFDLLIDNNRSQYALPFEERLEWDIFLTTAGTFKRSILKSDGIPRDIRKAMLIKNFPHFFWRAVAMHKGKPALEILFDASDLRQGRQVMATLFHLDGLGGPMQNFCKVVAAASLPDLPPLAQTVAEELARVVDPMKSVS